MLFNVEYFILSYEQVFIYNGTAIEIVINCKY